MIDYIKRNKIRWLLVFYDSLIFIGVAVLMLVFHPSTHTIFTRNIILQQMIMGYFFICGMRLLLSVYVQIWRYGGMVSYIRLIMADAIGGVFYVAFNYILPIGGTEFIRQLSIICLNLLVAIVMRMVYHYLYESANKGPESHKFAVGIIKYFCGVDIQNPDEKEVIKIAQKIKIAILGAGRVGASLAEELFNNPKAMYQPLCFIDKDKNKTGRSMFGIPVIYEKDITRTMLSDMGVQEIVLAIPHKDSGELISIYNYYSTLGYKVKVYDYPTMETVGGKRKMREFDIEELLFRAPKDFLSEEVKEYYRNKVVLITGGGGSIGSELCRQIARMQPKKLVILDVYENGAYDVEQELKLKYGAGINSQIEIVSVCDRRGLEEVFKTHRPNIVIHAAAHKHVPLMEHNAVEAVKNNVFGTLNTVLLTEKYDCERFMLVSTDKAVNPTNIMGATKRICEMITLSHAATSKTTTFTATRFGNVLGSAGSVIPLFKRQIQNGGPVTITDKRIIRYFMTIPEASQLVLTSGKMAKNGELFCLDMGKPVKILDLAENMIRLSGYEPYKDIMIIETGLRPGEKLYEELLIKTENMTKTENDLIFIEHDEPVSAEDLEEKLQILGDAVETESTIEIRKAVKRVVDTYKMPSE
ncbi:MAG: polysaccharide biosynthesis protein [Clostridia bacterium]|nr:polysaccharide biosynthesis protein [Clostridia bacterium]